MGSLKSLPPYPARPGLPQDPALRGDDGDVLQPAPQTPAPQQGRKRPWGADLGSSSKARSTPPGHDAAAETQPWDWDSEEAGSAL